MSKPFDVAHLRTWIGREDIAVGIVRQNLARKYQATLDFPGGDGLKLWTAKDNGLACMAAEAFWA